MTAPNHQFLLACTVALVLSGVSQAGQPQAGQDPGATTPERIDYLTFAQGAVPISIGGAGARLGADFEAAVRITDGDPTAFTIASGAGPDTDTEFVYQLPAMTTFDRFAVPGISETPSPTQTFTKLVEVQGSSSSATDGFVLLASATLQTHRARGLVTEIPIVARQPVRWIRLRLVGGINIMSPRSGLEFSEIIGNGTQEAPPLMTHFNGVWRTMAARMELKQQGPVVSGCYDSNGDLMGTVTGNILRAMGINRGDKTPSAFVLSVAPDGAIRGVRSSNGGPFRLFTLAVAPAGTTVSCGQPPPPALGCGSIIHGINFDFDSADIRPESNAILAELHKGLQGRAGAPDSRSKIVIEGHTSSEGTEDYNRRLSERRAQAVVADLVKRGLPAARATAAGVGEARPIAKNDDETGRALNRRVEVKCQ